MTSILYSQHLREHESIIAAAANCDVTQGLTNLSGEQLEVASKRLIAALGLVQGELGKRVQINLATTQLPSVRVLTSDQADPASYSITG